MEFDYQSAMDHVSQELDVLVKKYWPKIEALYEERGWSKVLERSERDKPEIIVENIRFGKLKVEDEKEWHLLSTLNDLTKKCYWHATDWWEEVSSDMDKEKKLNYENLMIEQAKAGHDRERIGYGWIVEKYNKGLFHDVISEELLREAVNIGFWEYAKEFFLGSASGNINYDRFTGLYTQSNLIDLTRLSEFIDISESEPLTNKQSWVSEHYVELFKEAEDKLDVESAAWLARPIIEAIISEAFSFSDIKDEPSAFYQEQTRPYKKYIDNPNIQEMLKERIILNMSYLTGDDNYLAMNAIEALRKDITLTDEEFKDFVSSILFSKEVGLYEENIPNELIETDFPIQWLDDTAKDKINKIIKEIFDTPGNRGDLFPHADFLQRCMKAGLFDEKEGKEKILEHVTKYLERKRPSKIPGGKPVKHLLWAVRPEYLDEEIYQEFVHTGINDLAYRNQTEEAAEWYVKAYEEGWLDDSKLSNETLVAISPEVTKRQKEPKQESIIKTNNIERMLEGKKPIIEKKKSGQMGLEDFE